MTHNISESEEECQEASNMNTDPIEQSSSNGDENQSRKFRSKKFKSKIERLDFFKFLSFENFLYFRFYMGN